MASGLDYTLVESEGQPDMRTIDVWDSGGWWDDNDDDLQSLRLNQNKKINIANLLQIFVML